MRPDRLDRLVAILPVLLITAAVVVTVAVLGDAATGPGPSVSTPVAAAERARVTRVVDGDTVVVAIDGREDRVRYIGMDAPELARIDAGTPAECGAVAAVDANRTLVEGAVVELESDVSDRDRFGRLLRHVWITIEGERRLVAELLVGDGAGEARSYPPDTRHDARLDAAERLARSEHAGIWGSC